LIILYVLQEISCFGTNHPPPPVSLNGFTGNQIPPPDTAYFDQFQKCGEINICNSQTGAGCLGRKKRSILRPNGKIKYQNQEGNDYIKGGDDVPYGRYPWIGRLVVRHDNNWIEQLIDGEFDMDRCTVSLISSRHVIFAKHCLLGTSIAPEIEDLPKLYGNKYEVKGNFKVTFGPPGEIDPNFVIKEFFIPPQPKSKSAHDIVVARIEEVVFSDTLRPICLPVFGIPASRPAVSVDFIGYGTTGYYDLIWPFSEKAKKADHLQELKNLHLTPKNTMSPPR